MTATPEVVPYKKAQRTLVFRVTVEWDQNRQRLSAIQTSLLNVLSTTEPANTKILDIKTGHKS